MGKIGRIERQPLKRQMILTFVWIMLLSAFCSIMTIGFGLWWLVQNNFFRPANTYENKLPAITSYVRLQHEAILNPSNRAELEKMIPAEGIRYQVVGLDGKPLYGTIADRMVSGREALINTLNRTVSAEPSTGIGGRYVRIDPVISKAGELKGAILLKYKLEVTSQYNNNNKGFNLINITLIVVLILLVMSPFLYIAVFTYLFAARLGRRIARPVHELIKASERISDQDLDFTVSYKAENELGLLTESFENMRSALKSSLLREWKLEQERRDMMDAIAHDFRTPMTVIQGNVELLADTPEMPRSQAEKHLKVIEDNIQRVNRLIQDVQVASEKDIEYFPLRTGEIRLQQFLQDKELEIGYICGSRQVRHSFHVEDFAPGAGEIVLVDVQRVSQVLDNLISNSLRYLPVKGGWLGIRIERHASMLQFEICDNGQGFNNKDLPHLFEKFYSGEMGQSGLGLYTAKIIVEKHGGSIRAYNRQEGGACITFTIRPQEPAAKDEDI
ncbi:HAMP domain-containing sensor histidine kinase [Paenibacillus azoreducens]|uniref:histidine kinase n=1 Tax=Paenibacillus azoreducens TaxID=116718 RepID=A0A920CM06_9BACL|nr:HAMP domain-containing sensor histidine kinase [Paenibacillus azoreducens]GIO45701.1 sensor histidine kinase [Paenibacillus azoreducens]